MHENRETSGVSRSDRDRSGKAQSRTPDVYAAEESDRVAVPMKPPNKEAQASAKVVEGRTRTEENTPQIHTPPAQDGRGVSQGLAGVRKPARERRQEPFTNLLHQLTTDLLRQGAALLQGLARCGKCGRRLHTHYTGRNASPGYHCSGNRRYQQSLGLEGRLDHRQRQREYRQRLKARVTDQSSLRLSACVNLAVAPAPESEEAAPAPDRRPSPGAELSAGWVICQICGGRGRWVNPFPEVKHDCR